MSTSTLPYKMDIRLFQGTTFSRKVSWIKKDDSTPAVDLTQFNAKLVFKPASSRNGVGLTLNSATSTSLTIDAVTGAVTINLTADQTARFKLAGEYWGTYILTLTPKVGREPIYALLFGDVTISAGA
jgi:hypothetical protein